MSEVSICNLALSWLGGNLIVSTELGQQGSTEDKLCAANYTLSRDAVLEDADWTFASTRAKPNKLAEQPLFGYGSAFQLPADFIRVIRVGRSPDFIDSVYDWTKEGDKILVNNADVLYLKYVYRLTDTSKFSPNFIQALAARIAADIAIPLTSNAQLYSTYWDLYQDKLNNAGITDGIQGVNRRVRSRFLTSNIR